MNKTILSTAVSAVLLFSMCSTTQAKSWRINNDTSKGAKFASINAAMDSELVTAGDTLYLDPGCTLSDNQNITKQVTIIGCGYFRRTSPHKFATITGTINLQTSGIKLEGLSCSNIDFTSRYTQDNVIIERCKTGQIYWRTYNGNCHGYNVTIRQCYITGSIYGGSDCSTGLTMENCIVISSDRINSIGENSTISNNYFHLDYSNGSCVQIDNPNTIVKNNIIVNSSTDTRAKDFSGEATFINNICTSRTSGGTNSKAITYTNINDFESALFALTGLNDERYTLKDDSPAKGWADDDGDCGPFGGQYPYVPGGMPSAAPYFTRATIGAKATGNELSVSLQIVQQEP